MWGAFRGSCPPLHLLPPASLSPPDPGSLGNPGEVGTFPHSAPSRVGHWARSLPLQRVP